MLFNLTNANTTLFCKKSLQLTYTPIGEKWRLPLLPTQNRPSLCCIQRTKEPFSVFIFVWTVSGILCKWRIWHNYCQVTMRKYFNSWGKTFSLLLRTFDTQYIKFRMRLGRGTTDSEILRSVWGDWKLIFMYFDYGIHKLLWRKMGELSDVAKGCS